jgi:hypothetical protein
MRLAAYLTQLIMLTGCAGTTNTTDVQPKAQSTITNSTANNPAPVKTITTKPSWLLIGGVDVDTAHGGDQVGVRDSLSDFGGFNIVDSSSWSPLWISFASAGHIVYWKGSGEITNISTGERIVVPLSNP